MDKAKYTKGKWVVYSPNHAGCTNVKFGKDEWDGYIELWHHHSNKKEADANALLISKAHEMLEFIKNHYRYLNLRDQETAERLIKEATEL